MWTAGWGTAWGPWWGCSTLNCGGPGVKPTGWTPLEKITHTCTQWDPYILRGDHCSHLRTDALQSSQRPCHLHDTPALALNLHTHLPAFTKTIKSDLSRKSAPLLPQVGNWTRSSPEGVISVLLLASREWRQGYTAAAGSLPAWRPSAPVYIPLLCCDICCINICVTLHFNIQREHAC